MSRYRRLKIEGGAFFYMLALANRGSDPLVRFGEQSRGALGRLRPSLTGYGACAPLPTPRLLGRISRTPSRRKIGPRRG